MFINSLLSVQVRIYSNYYSRLLNDLHVIKLKSKQQLLYVTLYVTIHRVLLSPLNVYIYTLE